MKPTHLATCLAIGTAISLVATIAQPVHLDLTSQFDTDAVLEPGGTPLSGPLDLELERIDGQSLPTAYADGTAFTTPDGRASFLFAPLRSASRDALVINGQTLTCPAAPYAFLDLALLAAPNSYGNPFSAVEFRYTDGSRAARRFGPVPG